MKQFKVGDQVISLTDQGGQGSQKREKGKIYEVKRTAYCIGCGEQRINIGNVTNNDFVMCGQCQSTQETFGAYWTSASHFIKVSGGSISKAIEYCLENEAYEDAAFLRDFLKTQK